MSKLPVSKILATIGGAGLTGTAVWLNAEHVAASEGWHSPLVVAGIIITLCAASTPPFAERAAKTGQLFKAIALWTFFFLAVWRRYAPAHHAQDGFLLASIDWHSRMGLTSAARPGAPST